MKDNHKKILKKYIKVDEPFGSEEAFNISASDFRKLGEDIQRKKKPIWKNLDIKNCKLWLK